MAADRRLDPRTVNYVHTIVHRAFKDAVRWGRLARNPADAADPPRGGQKSDGVHSWDAATLRKFLAASSASGDRLHPLWVLLATTGMRRGEALGLRWSDVDLDAGRLRVVQTIIQVRSKVDDRRAQDGARPAPDRPRRRRRSRCSASTDAGCSSSGCWSAPTSTTEASSSTSQTALPEARGRERDLRPPGACRRPSAA